MQYIVNTISLYRTYIIWLVKNGLLYPWQKLLEAISFYGNYAYYCSLLHYMYWNYILNMIKAVAKLRATD